jgi:hypothetical protein
MLLPEELHYRMWAVAPGREATPAVGCDGTLVDDFSSCLDAAQAMANRGDATIDAATAATAPPAPPRMEELPMVVSAVAWLPAVTDGPRAVCCAACGVLAPAAIQLEARSTLPPGDSGGGEGANHRIAAAAWTASACTCSLGCGESYCSVVCRAAVEATGQFSSHHHHTPPRLVLPGCQLQCDGNQTIFLIS